SILDKYQIKDKIEIILEDGHIVLKPIDQPRKGWDQAFKKMHNNGDDQLLIDDVFEDESFEQWD
ncbi:MAG: AbrB/MazE/SpoVT family DNA-binding domain-containing protein, partial [Bacteroidota bacterium]|nr:AbrB/MazE/SpoVT family DNA-binding domain-containing protein [Bacteroidota bacterium]